MERRVSQYKLTLQDHSEREREENLILERKPLKSFLEVISSASIERKNEN